MVGLFFVSGYCSLFFIFINVMSLFFVCLIKIIEKFLLFRSGFFWLLIKCIIVLWIFIKIFFEVFVIFVLVVKDGLVMGVVFNVLKL